MWSIRVRASSSSGECWSGSRGAASTGSFSIASRHHWESSRNRFPAGAFPASGGRRRDTRRRRDPPEGTGPGRGSDSPRSQGEPDDGNSRFFGGVAGNAGLFGTARGVLALAWTYLGAGEFLDRGGDRTATADHTPGLEAARGLAWQLATSPGCSAGSALDPTAFGHTGFTGTSLWVDPTRGMAMTLLANRVHPGHRPTDLHPLRRRFHQLVVDSLA